VGEAQVQGGSEETMRKKKVAKLFERGTPLDPRHLLGRNGSEAEWTVRMLTGPVLDLGFLKHRKRFWLEEGVPKKLERVVGCNVLRKGSRWGHFAVRKGDAFTPTTFDYGDAGNGLSRLFADEVRVTDYAFLVVGKFYVRLLGRKVFVGYFSLRRRGDRPRANLRREPRPADRVVARWEDWK
jgi:hypothetical protein